jgi:hypothetical protein
MKIFEIINPKTPSAKPDHNSQDLVAQDIVPEKIDGTIVEHPDHSAIAEGVSQILRRVKGKGLKTGFRCTSGPRKGRIVSKPSTCFARRDPVKGAKIAKKRQAKASTAGKKMAITKRSGGGSRRLQKTQIKTRSTKIRKMGGSKKPFQKGKVVKPK